MYLMFIKLRKIDFFSLFTVYGREGRPT